MSASASASASQEETVATEKPVQMRKFHNGWTAELDDLIADWADKAACYRWMHEYASKQYESYNSGLMLPIIILSTLSGVANFGIESVIGGDDFAMKWAQFGVGGVTILSAILTTLANYYSFAKMSESNRVASMSWSKFNRLLCIEMRLHPDERTDSLQFIKMFRTELDRLVELSPIIPDNIIKKFNRLFQDNKDITKPEITGIIERTPIFKDSGERLKRVAAEATIMIHHKKGIMKQMVMEELNAKIEKITRDIVTKMFAEQDVKKIAEERITNEKDTIKKLREEADVKFPSVYTDKWANPVDQLNVVVSADEKA